MAWVGYPGQRSVGAVSPAPGDLARRAVLLGGAVTALAVLVVLALTLLAPAGKAAVAAEQPSTRSLALRGGAHPAEESDGDPTTDESDSATGAPAGGGAASSWTSADPGGRAPARGVSAGGSGPEGSSVLAAPSAPAGSSASGGTPVLGGGPVLDFAPPSDVGGSGNGGSGGAIVDGPTSGGSGSAGAGSDGPIRVITGPDVGTAPTGMPVAAPVEDDPASPGCNRQFTDPVQFESALASAGPDDVICISGAAAKPAATKAVAFARAQLGVPYVWAGNGKADGGYDCSGLTTASFSAAGVRLPRTAQAQYSAGPRLPANVPLQAGDLVFFGTGPRSVTHVGLAVSPTKMINAPQTGEVIKVAPIRRKDFVGATRPAPPAIHAPATAVVH
ncbi:MAG TPA: C40 family peptidase [Pseudonocardia sp.]